MLGTSTNTLTVPGLPSAASSAAQALIADPVLFVTTDLEGNLATQAMGAGLTASSTAFGTDALAIGPGDTAIGAGATVLSDGATAVGANSLVGDNATNTVAIGADTVATAQSATAIGQASEATFVNSTAIGQGVTTSRANQVAIGGASNTYTLAGVGSDASRAAQSGPRQVLTTDAAGNIAGDGGALFDSFNNLEEQVDENSAGVALAIAMTNVPQLSGDKKFSLGFAIGTFEGEVGYAAGASVRFTDALVGRASVGGSSESGFGAGAGVAFQF